MSPHTFTLFLWIGFYNFTQQAMEFQKDVLGWLDEATLYHAKQEQVNPSDDFCIDELFFPGEGKEKGVDGSFLDIPDVSDILDQDGWLNEKIDLSVLDATFQDCLANANSIEPEKFDTSAELASLMDTHYLDNNNTFLPFAISSPVPTETISEAQNNPSTSQAFTISSEPSPSSFILPEVGLQLPSSPAESSCSVFSSQIDVSSPSHSDADVSDNLEITSENESNSLPLSSDAVCVQILTVPEDDYMWSSVVRSGKQTTVSRKSAKAAAQPYSLSPFQMKKESRRERKKVQNKEAAARYRMKKREQDKVLGDEVAVLEKKQESLQDQHDSLKNEIKYLKSLMREMFKARGLLK